AAVPLEAGAAEGRQSATYFAVSGFFLGLTDTEIRDITAGGIERDMESDDGWGGGLALGYGSRGGLRFEVEGAYRKNDANLRPGGPVLPASEGDIHSIAIMGNLYFEPQLKFPVNPYIGAGAGYANVALDVNDLDIDDDDWVFAYQAMAGAVLKLGAQAGLFAGYRYFATDDPAFQGTDIEYRTHNLEVGLRFGF
ncbi:MAG TPA: outer membrane beta-barrel protein, partial [Thermodesulfobacteriota bacterium]